MTVKVEIHVDRVVVRRYDHYMRVIAKIIRTIHADVVLICRCVLIRLRARVVSYEDAIYGDITSRSGRSAAWEIICVCENEKYPDGDTCKIEQFESGKDLKTRALKEHF